jgi:hypothetical protein
MSRYRFNDGPSAAPQVLTNPNQPVDGAFNPRAGNKDFFWYSTRITSLAAAASTSSSILLDADADFYMVAMTYQADIAGAVVTQETNPIPLVTVLITDSGSGYALSNNPIPVGALMGDGKMPYRLIRPRVFAAQAQVQFAYTNYSNATTYNLTLVLHGYKVRLGG